MVFCCGGVSGLTGKVWTFCPRVFVARVVDGGPWRAAGWREGGKVVWFMIPCR